MSRERKSPQEKKQLEYTKDHFTFGWQSPRNFLQTWSCKKVLAQKQAVREKLKVLRKAIEVQAVRKAEN